MYGTTTLIETVVLRVGTDFLRRNYTDKSSFRNPINDDTKLNFENNIRHTKQKKNGRP